MAEPKKVLAEKELHKDRMAYLLMGVCSNRVSAVHEWLVDVGGFTFCILVAKNPIWDDDFSLPRFFGSKYQQPVMAAAFSGKDCRAAPATVSLEMDGEASSRIYAVML